MYHTYSFFLMKNKGMNREEWFAKPKQNVKIFIQKEKKKKKSEAYNV